MARAPSGAAAEKATTSLSLLTAAGRAALPRFVYKGTDHSLIYRLCTSHLADWLVHRLTPRWVAPNLITFAGLVLQALALAVAAAAVPGFRATAVPAAGAAAAAASAALAAACLLLYSTLDNMDGKQARRTGSSSPLGLIFDHGCDAVNAALIGWAAFALHVCAGGPASWQVLALWAVPTAPFFMNTWEEFHVGALVLPLVNGPNEGLTLSIAMLAATALTPGGAAFWQQPPPSAALLHLAALLTPVVDAARAAFGDTAVVGSPVSLLDLVLALSIVIALATSLLHTSNVLRFERAAIRGKVRGSLFGGPAVWHSWASAMARQAPMWLLLAICALWLRSAACRAVVEAHWLLFYSTAGCLFVDLTVRIMVAHVCAQDLESMAPRALFVRFGLFALPPLALAAAGEGGAVVSAGTALQVARLGLLLAFSAASLCLLAFVHQALRDVVEVLDVDIFSIERQVARHEAGELAAAAKAFMAGSALVVEPVLARAPARRRRSASARR